uniref:Uncharacterized protein n=1 Tax=Daphnia galeata TaxID=27404 RepID=A0A8J2RC80_9CRUS|nr:unnamed protein product [Daphnia galeata]
MEIIQDGPRKDLKTTNHTLEARKNTTVDTFLQDTTFSIQKSRKVFLHTNILPSLFNIPHGRFAILRKAGTRTVQQFCIHTHTHTYREVRFSPSFGVPFLVRFKQHQIFGVNEFRFYVD